MKISPPIQNALLLILLALIWGSAFSFIKIAVGSIPPVTLAASRVVIAALVLFSYARLKGIRLPTSKHTWRLCFWIGFTGAAAPFCLIAWGEQHISSSTASIAMALVPLITLLMAHFMTENEKISLGKFFGILLGFSGVFLLFKTGGSKAGQNSTEAAFGLGAVILALTAYALSGILSTRLKDVPRISSAAAIMISSSVLILPLSLVVDHPWALNPSWASIGSVIILGLFPTAFAFVMLIYVIERAGATYLSLSNYLVPVVGLLLGILWLDEKFLWQTGLALVLICVGIFITGRKINSKNSAAPKTSST